VAEEAGHANRRVLILRDADAADDAAWANDPECLLVRRHGADGLDNHMRPLSVCELADPRDTRLAASRDDVRGAELPAELGARRVSAHEDDLLGAEALG
jgi:hypothetical protein